jgi:uncharacterized membrane protein required for colicin V production
MKEILDIVVVILFVIVVFGFIRGFNKQQINKHTNKLEEIEKREKEKDE